VVLEKLKQKVRELTHEVLKDDVGKPAATGKARRKPKT